MSEAEVLDNPIEQAKIISEESAAEVEDRYGDPAKAEKLKDKVEKKKDALPKKETPAAEIKTDIKKEEPKKEVKDEKKKEIVTEKDQKKPEQKKIFDPLGELTEKKVEPKEKEVNLTDLEKHPDFVKSKADAENWRKVNQNPVLKGVLEAVANGKDPYEVLAEIQPVDFKKSYAALAQSDKEFADKQLATLYYTRVEKLEGDDLKASVEEFIGADEGNSKRRERNGYFQALDNDQSDRIGKYNETVQSSQKRNQDNQNQFLSDVEKVIETSYRNAEPYGLKLTPEQSKELEDDSKGFFKNLFDDQGKVKAKQVAFYTFAEKYLRKLITDSYNNGGEKKELEILEEIHHPDPNDTSQSNRRQPPAEKSDKERIDEEYGGETKVK